MLSLLEDAKQGKPLQGPSPSNHHQSPLSPSTQNALFTVRPSPFLLLPFPLAPQTSEDKMGGSRERQPKQRQQQRQLTGSVCVCPAAAAVAPEEPLPEVPALADAAVVQEIV